MKLDFVQEIVEKFQIGLLWAIGRPPNMSKMAQMGLQILMKEVRNYIAGHKYRRGA